MSEIRVKVEKVLFDPKVRASIVVLKEEDGDRELTIWIGQSEALAIALAIEQVELPRPMTHDLMHSLLETLGVSLLWVKIHVLKQGTYYSSLHIAGPDGELDVDSRPSDALALALRMKAPVFVADKVFEEAQKLGKDRPFGKEDIDEEFLAELPDEVFGKYKM